MVFEVSIEEIIKHYFC